MRLTGSLFLLIFIHAISIVQSQEQIILVNGFLKNLSIKGISLNPLYQVSKGFSELEAFGKPTLIDSVYRTAEPKWTFHYTDFSLTYVQFNPNGPELLKIEVMDESAEFLYNEKYLFDFNIKSLKKEFESFEIKAIDRSEINRIYYGSSNYTLEYYFSDKEVKKITYRIDPNL